VMGLLGGRGLGEGEGAGQDDVEGQSWLHLPCNSV
jgi:hypothetical protein